MHSVATFDSTVILTPAEPRLESALRPKLRKPPVWTAFATLAAAAIVGWLTIMASVIGLGVVTGFIMGAQGADAAAIQGRMIEIGQQPLVALLFSLVPFQLGMALVVLLAARCSKEPIKLRLGLEPQSGRIVGAFKLATMAAFTTSIAYLSFIFSSLLAGPPPEGNAIANVITDGSWWMITLASIILSVIPALVEESLFRGLLQRRFLQRWSPAVAIGLSTLLFAVMHFDSLQHIIAVIPLGLVTGLLAYRTNSVKPGMLVHAIHNTAAIGLASLATTIEPFVSQETLGLLVLGTIAVLGIIGLPAVISLLRNPRASIVTNVALETIAEPVSLPSRELLDFASDSQLASAV